MRLTILVLVLVATPAAALADAPAWEGPPGMAPRMVPQMAPEPPPPPVTREVSYARQTLISDAIAAALIVAAIRDDNDPHGGFALFMSGVYVYGLGAPIVHFANRQWGNGLKSLGARVALPWLGMMAGNLLGPKDTAACAGGGGGCDGSSESTKGLLIGAAVGALAAVAVDARAFANKRVVEKAPAYAPAIGYAPAGFTVGVGGSF